MRPVAATEAMPEPSTPRSSVEFLVTTPPAPTMASAAVTARAIPVNGGQGPSDGDESYGRADCRRPSLVECGDRPKGGNPWHEY
jgi:hypothetical protein